MIYCIGAVTGIDELNRPAFESARALMLKERPTEEVVIPHDRIASDATWNQAMRTSISIMMEADTVCVVCSPNLVESRGYRIESAIAHALDIPMLYVDGGANHAD